MQPVTLKFTPPPHILAEQLRFSQRQLTAAVRLGILLAIAISWIFYPVVPKYLLFSWLACLIGISIIRIISLRHIASPDFKESEATRYAIRYVVTAFLLGSTWASLAFLLPHIGTDERILVFVLLISIAGGALTTTAGHIISFYAYTLPILASYAVNAFLLQGYTWTLLGVLTIVYAIYMALAGWKLYTSLYENIALRYRWQATANDLKRTKEELDEELQNRTHAEEKLKSVMAELELAVVNLKQLAAIDKLTNIPNRRSFDAAIARNWNSARRHQTSIALLMIDIDHFKSYNDLYHHQKGDEALQRVAQTLKQFAQRPGDIAARYGGEEFALILVEPDKEFVALIAEKLRQQVHDLKIKHEASETSEYITVSIGTALYTAPKDDDYSILINSADNALYEAKHSGRNKVCAHTD